MSSRDPFEKWWPRIRDVGTSSIGGYLLLFRVDPANPNVTLVTVAVTLLVVPGASLAQRIIRGKIEEDEEEEKWTHLP